MQLIFWNPKILSVIQCIPCFNSYFCHKTIHRKRKGKDKGRPISNEVVPEPEVVLDPAKEAELLLTNRFKAFDHGMREIEKILTRWDRTIGMYIKSKRDLIMLFHVVNT